MERAIEVLGLTKVYQSKIKALDSVDLSVEEGRIFALLGPNGAGKTTLMRILTTQLRPTAGQAFVFHRDVVRKSAEVRSYIGYVPQEMSVWTDVTGYENLLIYAKIYGVPGRGRKKMIRDILESMGLASFGGELVKNYSGGMIRRLEIAVALLTRPRIMFFDEPTIGLDPAARKAVWEKILTFKRDLGTTVFFNTHYMDEADLYSDEIAIIDQGKLVKKGTAEELKRSIQRDIVELTLGPGTPAPGLPDRMRSLALVTGATFENSVLQLSVTDTETALPAVLEAVRKEGLAINRISASKPTLDDVFLAYAGTSLLSGSGYRETRRMRTQIKKG
jgi:ABC-2 type transport system ATP-binding protein